MPDIITTRRSNRPSEGFHTALLPEHSNRPVRFFLPSDYQPKYAYPLVVLFHSSGGDEDAAARLVPLLSRRNYIAACPRGPVALGCGPTGQPGFAWGGDPRADEYLLATVAHARQEFHVHAERVYLIGIGEGASAAYRVALAMAGKVAGLVILNGQLPRVPRRPVFRFQAMRELRVFIGTVPITRSSQLPLPDGPPVCSARPERMYGQRPIPLPTASTPTCCAM